MPGRGFPRGWERPGRGAPRHVRTQPVAPLGAASDRVDPLGPERPQPARQSPTRHLASRRLAAFVVAAAVVVTWFIVAPHLAHLRLWPTILVLSILVMPGTLLLALIALPLWRRRWLFPAAIVLGLVAFGCAEAG